MSVSRNRCHHCVIILYYDVLTIDCLLQRGTKTVERRKPLQRGRGSSDRHRAARDPTVAEFRTTRAHRPDAFAGQVERRSDSTAAVFRHRRSRSADAAFVVHAAQRQAQHGFADGLVRRGMWYRVALYVHSTNLLPTPYTIIIYWPRSGVVTGVVVGSGEWYNIILF